MDSITSNNVWKGKAFIATQNAAISKANVSLYWALQIIDFDYSFMSIVVFIFDLT